MLTTLSLTLAPLLVEPVDPIVIDNPLADDSQFGRSLCWSNDRLVVGAPNTSQADKHGAAFVFRQAMNSSEYEVTKPLFGAPPDPTQYPAKFGWSVACRPDILVVGAPGEFIAGIPNQGAAYTFVYDEMADIWSEHPIPRLTFNKPSASDQFGLAAAITGDALVIGAPGYDNGFDTNIGAFSTYALSPGALTLKEITEDIQIDNAAHGSVLASSGDTVVVVAPGDAGQTRVVIYRVNVGVLKQEQIITPADMASPACGDALPDGLESIGAAVAIDGDTLLVGAPLTKEPQGTLSGVVYAFDRDNITWTCAGRLIPAEPQEAEGFGNAVALRGDLALVGATAHSGMNPAEGAVYSFSRADGKGWIQQPGTLFGTGYEEEMGCRLAIADDRLAVSSCGARRVTVYTLKASLGEACQLADECASGVCADGVCCDDAQCVDSQCWRCDGGAMSGQCAIDEGADCDGGAGCDLEAGVCGMAPDETSGGATSSGGSSDSDGSSVSGEAPTTSSGFPPDPGDTDTGVSFDLPDLFDGCECNSSGGSTPWLWCSLLLLAHGRPRRRPNSTR